MKADGSDPVDLTRRAGIVGGTPDWSPDATRIAFVGVAPGEQRFGIYLIVTSLRASMIVLLDRDDELLTGAIRTRLGSVQHDVRWNDIRRQGYCVCSGPGGRVDMAPEIPEVIQRYQDAHDSHDVEVALAAFSADATVQDEGQQWRGTTEIRNWLNKTSSEYTFTRTLLGVETAGAGLWEVRNRLEGNFPGNVVDLRYRFALDGDKITNLMIAS